MRDVANALNDLRCRRTIPDHYTVVPGIRPGSWYLTIGGPQASIASPDGRETDLVNHVLAKDPHIESVRDVSHAAIQHCCVGLNLDHPEALFLHQVTTALHGKTVNIDGEDVRRFSMPMEKLPVMQSFLRAFPGLGRSLRVNPSFEYLPLATAEHPINEVRPGDLTHDRPDFSPGTARSIAIATTVKVQDADLRVLGGVAQAKLRVESISVRTKTNAPDLMEVVVVIDDAFSHTIEGLRASVSGTAFGVLGVHKRRPETALQYVQAVLSCGDTATKSALRQINQRFNSHGRTVSGRDVRSTSLSLAEAAQAKGLLARSAIPFLPNASLVPSLGDSLPSHDLFREHFPAAYGDFRRSMEVFLMEQLGLKAE